MTGVSEARKPACPSTSTARAGVSQKMRTMPKSAVSAMNRAFMLMSASANVRQAAASRPFSLARKTVSCEIITGSPLSGR